MVTHRAVTRQNSRRNRSLRVYCATNKIETFDDRSQVHVGLPNKLGSRGRGLLSVLSERVEKLEVFSAPPSTF